MIKFWITLFFCLWINPLFAALDPSLPHTLYKQKLAITLDLKQYQLPGDESIQLYGAKRRHFMTDHWYWGEVGYGAISGRRSGYLEGGIMVGWMGKIHSMIYLESRLFAGAGGGGSAPQGGGLIVNPTVGAWIPLTPGVLVGGELGYIEFLNGSIQSMTIGFGLTFFLWELVVVSDRQGDER